MQRVNFENELLSSYENHIANFPDIYEEFLLELRNLPGDQHTDCCRRYQYKCLDAFIKGRPSIAFVCPTSVFRSNFGRLPQMLEDSGCAVLYLYGERHNDAFEGHRGSFRVINFEEENSFLLGIKNFVTPIIMECLPENSIKILHDHLSSVIFFPHYIDENDYKTEDKSSMESLIEIKGLKPVLQPLYDYHLVPSSFVKENIMDNYRSLGYFHISGEAEPDLSQVNKTMVKLVDDYLKGKRIVNSSTIVNTGYIKIEDNIRYFRDKKHENVITYAPTPNKHNIDEIWNGVISVNEYGKELVDRLCREFPDYVVVFKPYIEEDRELVESIVKHNEHHQNFEFYMGDSSKELYARTKLMVSDLSSTAYTFAVSTKRPVVFFSPFEKMFGTRIKDTGSYLSSREYVGELALDMDQMVAKIHQIFDGYDTYVEKVQNFRDTYIYNAENVSEVMLRTLLEILHEQPISCDNTVVTKIVEI